MRVSSKKINNSGIKVMKNNNKPSEGIKKPDSTHQKRKSSSGNKRVMEIIESLEKMYGGRQNNSHYTEHLGIVLSKKQLDDLNAACEKVGRNRSDVLRELIDDFIKKNES